MSEVCDCDREASLEVYREAHQHVRQAMDLYLKLAALLALSNSGLLTALWFALQNKGVPGTALYNAGAGIQLAITSLGFVFNAGAFSTYLGVAQTADKLREQIAHFERDVLSSSIRTAALFADGKAVLTGRLTKVFLTLWCGVWFGLLIFSFDTELYSVIYNFFVG